MRYVDVSRGIEVIEVQLETVPKTWRQFWAAVGPYETGINRAERRAHVHVLWTAYKNGTPVHEITTPTGVEIED